MRVTLNAAISGTRNGQPWPPIGAEIDLPDSEAADLCAAGLAVPVPVTEVAKAEKRPASKRTEKRA